MSYAYDEYLKKHRKNVADGFDWFVTNMLEILPQYSNIRWQILNHDRSKDDPDEYDAYDAYFYGDSKTKKVEDDFDKAWLRHIHLNPHHWQHWVLVQDDGIEKVLEMPVKYVIEMICDWWSFSRNEGDLFEIFDWYEKHKDLIKFHPNTRKLVEDILDEMKKKLEAAVEK